MTNRVPRVRYCRRLNSYTNATRIEGLGKAIREAKIDPVSWNREGKDPLLQLCILDAPHSWFSLNTSWNLIIRSRYDEIWQRIEKAYKDRLTALAVRKDETTFERALILGNSGLGKTVSLNYYMKRAVEQQYPVLVETRVSRFFFEPGKADVYEEDVKAVNTELSNLRKDPNILLFHDHEQKKEPPLLDAGAFTVSAVSPDTSNCKEYTKHKCLEMWAPLPTIEEIRGMKPILAPNMSNEELDYRISIVGRNIRLIFSSNFKQILRKLKRRISDFDMGKFARSEMFSEGLIPNNASGLSWWIVNVDASDDLEDPGSITWASDYIRDEVLTRLLKKDLHDAAEICCSMVQSEVDYERPTGLFENWSVRYLATGKKVACFKGKTKVELEFEPHDVIYVSKLPTLQTMKENVGKIFFFGRNNPSYDASAVMKVGDEWVLILLQATIGKKHGDLKKEVLSTRPNILNDARKDEMKIRFLFLVPFKRNFSLSEEQKKKADPASIEVVELNPCNHY